jgi:alkylation response protein AidB-like acyl-CoA dehydrogenase
MTELMNSAIEPDMARVETAVSALLASVESDPPPDHKELLRRRFDLGLAWVQNPREEGGLGVSPDFQRLVEDRLFEAGLLALSDQRAAQRNMYMPLLREYGTAAQRSRYLRGLFTEDEMWCLLLSEPNAGSDLAGVATSAVRDGDEWILNGQKVWSSLAHRADVGFILVRHDPEAARHKGLSVFIVDMHAPGVEARPIRQMTGDAEFNEVFFTDVRVPDGNRVGDLGQGWALIMAAVANERLVIGNDITMRGIGPLTDAMTAWQAAGISDETMLDRMTELWVEGEVIRLFGLRLVEANEAGHAGLESNMLKLRFTQFQQDIYEFIVDLMGPEGLLYPDDYEFHVFDEFGLDGHDPRRNFLASRSRTIGGGTSEILRSALAERALGLPREPKPAAR